MQKNIFTLTTIYCYLLKMWSVTKANCCFFLNILLVHHFPSENTTFTAPSDFYSVSIVRDYSSSFREKGLCWKCKSASLKMFWFTIQTGLWGLWHDKQAWQAMHSFYVWIHVRYWPSKNCMQTIIYQTDLEQAILFAGKSFRSLYFSCSWPELTQAAFLAQSSFLSMKRKRE